MPFAPQIRKTILDALEDHVLPNLQQQQVKHALARAPFDFGDLPHWCSQKKHLPDQISFPSQVRLQWEKQKMLAGLYPFIGFIYEGVMDYRIGVTEQAAKCSKTLRGSTPPGIITVRLTAPAFIYFHPGVPGHDGSTPFHDISVPGGGAGKAIFANVMGNDVNVHYCFSNQSDIVCSHTLQRNEPDIQRILQLYLTQSELENRSLHAMQALLFVLFQRMHYYLKFQQNSLANTAFPLNNTFDNLSNNAKDVHHLELCQRAMAYIEKNLHVKLERDVIAQDIGVSSGHLSHVFQLTVGISLMRYVTKRRIEAAKMLLTDGIENINEIAQLTGFSSLHSFSTIFKRQVGVSPQEHRRNSVLNRM